MGEGDREKWERWKRERGEEQTKKWIGKEWGEIAVHNFDQNK